MSTTESPFSLTIKIGPNNDLLTGRADTLEEMLTRIDSLLVLQERLQGVATQVTTTQPAYPAAPTDPHVAAQANLAAAGIASTPVVAGIEEQSDKFGNRFLKGDPNGASCVHGPRITAHKTSKAGKPYKAFVCVNDSPFGDYRQGKCPQEYPER